MNRKDEVRLLLLSENEEGRFSATDNFTQRYVRSFRLLIQKEAPLRYEEFKIAYAGLLIDQRVPFFKLETVMLLFRKWCRYPQIFSDITFLAGKLKKNDLPEAFWFQVIKSSALERTSRELLRSRLNLLVIIVRSGVLRNEEFETHGVVIDAIMRITVRSEEHAVLKKGLSLDPSHPYHRMCFAVGRLVRLRISTLELAEIIRCHFSPPDVLVTWTPEARSMHDQLEGLLPANYLLDLKRHEFQKLHFLFMAQPALFNKLSVQMEGPVFFKDLVRALFSDFMISGTFIHAFCNDQLSELEKAWFKDELNGVNIVYSDCLPLKLTKKAAHHFRCLPENGELTVTLRLIASQLFTLVEDDQFAVTVSRAIRNTGQADFWIETMSGLYKKGLRAQGAREIMDYIEQKVFREGIKLDLKYKKLDNLLEDVHAWHEQLRTQKMLQRVGYRKLPIAEIPDFKVLYEDCVYGIEQLKRTNELYYEGEFLEHCVYSYRHYCLDGDTYIFSLRRFDENKNEVPLITIELNRKKQVLQARGKHNRNPTEMEISIIRMWAEENGLSHTL